VPNCLGSEVSRVRSVRRPIKTIEAFYMDFNTDIAETITMAFIM